MKTTFTQTGILNILHENSYCVESLIRDTDIKHYQIDFVGRVINAAHDAIVGIVEASPSYNTNKCEIADYVKELEKNIDAFVCKLNPIKQ